LIHVLLLDDHAVVRAGYRQLIDAEPDMCVVAACATSAQACEQLRLQQVDVAVVDLSLKDDSGLQAIQRLRARLASLRVLVFTMHAQQSYALQALRAGALGYLTKDSDPQAMLDAVRQVAQGRRVFSSDLIEAMLDPLEVERGGPLRQLTPREFDVLRLAAQGLATRAIAEAMHLGDKTVLNYMSLIRQKLGAANDLQLLRLAAQNGLVEL
jgi:DNA-binding NarL/FixJ family response regulator